MNQFRDISTVVLVALGIGLLVSDPNDWHWADIAGPYVAEGLSYLEVIHPFPSIICFAVAGCLFMTRLKY